MKNALIAATAGLLLVAGQAAAANTTAPRIVDRLGQDTGGAGAAPAGAQGAGLPFAVLFLAGFTAIAVASSDDDSESD